MTVAPSPSRPDTAAALVTLADALALLAVAGRLHRAPDERTLRAGAAIAVRDLLAGTSVRCDVVHVRVPSRTSGHEIVRSTGGPPALVLTVVRHPGRMSQRDDAIVTLLAGSLASAWELVRLREASPAADPALLAPLTPRELQVLALVARGATNAQAGSRLGIGARTVEKHLEHIAAKLGARGRTAASALYLGALAAAR